MRRLFLRKNTIRILSLLVLLLFEQVQNRCVITRVEDVIRCYKVPNTPTILGTTHCVVPDRRQILLRHACEEGPCVFKDGNQTGLCLFEYRGVSEPKDSKNFNCAAGTHCFLSRCRSRNVRCDGDFACVKYNERYKQLGICETGTVTTNTTTSTTTTTTTSTVTRNAATTSTATTLPTISTGENHTSTNNTGLVLDERKAAKGKLKNRSLLRLIGIINGILIFLLLLIGVAFYIWRKWRRRRADPMSAPSNKSSHPDSESSTTSRRLSSQRDRVNAEEGNTIDHKRREKVIMDCLGDRQYHTSKSMERDDGINRRAIVENEEHVAIELSPGSLESTTDRRTVEDKRISKFNKPLKKGIMKYASREDDTVCTTATVEDGRIQKNKNLKKRRKTKNVPANQKTQPDKITLVPQKENPPNENNTKENHSKTRTTSLKGSSII